MDNFKYYAPTRICFGKNAEINTGRLCKEAGATKVLLHYGGSSARKSGLLDRVCASLKEENIPYVSLGGVVPNPRLIKIREGIELCRKERVDLILAVGGGSVIDSAKAIGYGLYGDDDVWDYYLMKKIPQGSIPVGAVLTMAAAGSEMSNSSVVTNEDGWLKRGLTTPYGYCKFAVMNPELTYTLPAYQTASGCVDIIMHTLERYFTTPAARQLEIIDGISEELLRTVIRNAPRALKNPADYDARAEIMWCSTLSHNDTTGERGFGDWACHQLEHELSGIYDVAHGAGLASIWGSWARYVAKDAPERFAQLAVNVFRLPADFRNPEAVAFAGIEAMESFFSSIGMPTSIGELGISLTEARIKELAYKCSFMNTRTIGQFKVLTTTDMENIYRTAL